VLGKIVGAFGVGGWVKIESYTDPPENILQYPVWRLSKGDGAKWQSEWRQVKRLAGRMTAKGVQVQFEQVFDRTVAEQLRGLLIWVPRSELPGLAAGQYYWDDLVGLQAYSPQGELLGTVSDIRSMPAHAVLVIATERAGKRIEYSVPLVKQRLLKVDLAARRATVDWDSSW
jgi:16S rRNA processing protein RimM